ncbi:MAG: hypothetical protein D6820_11320 [Lentisphaerae bacterium]|nr:MAG: hypothetical protein D6820_11320 [Lentisphaerota bacterium]
MNMLNHLRIMTLFLVAFFCMHSVEAKVPEEIKKKLDKQIRQELEKQLKVFVDEKQLATLFKFEYPVAPPSKPLAEIEKEVHRYLEEEARKKYPDNWVFDQLDKHRDQFVQWQQGDRVSVKLKSGKVYSGWLRYIDQTVIQVNAVRIYRKDLSEESILHLDPMRAARARNILEQRFRQQLRALREQFKREHELTATRDLYTKYGYMKIRGKWVPKIQYFQERVQQERERYRKLLEPVLTYQVYYKAGYRQFKGEWYTPEEAERLRELARIEEELRPKEIMALMDALNAEGSAKISKSTLNKLFGDGKDKKGAGKKGEDKMEKRAKEIKKNIKLKKELLDF